jgi:hypothetical protein
MHTATIEVQYVNEPKEGKKMGTVKTVDGEYYSVWPDKLSLYKPGGTYEVQYTESPFQGKMYKTIKAVKGAGGQPSRAQASGTASSPRGNTQSREMFAMGTIGRCLQGSGTYPDGATLEGWLRDAFQAWDNATAPAPAKNDLDDEIPF